ncbi:hypothetical protein SLA2020_289310 [Shorea laevis]
MDPPYHHHHQQQQQHQHLSRYGPFPPSVQQTPDLYGSRHHTHHNHHHHLPPPPPPQQLPSSQHQSYHTLPPPPQPPPPSLQHQLYHSHHPQFTHSPNFNPNPNSTHQFHELPHRPAFEEEPSHRVPDFDTRADFWVDSRRPRQHPVASLDRESHYHQLDRRPPTIDSLRYDLEVSSRFRNEYDGDRFEQNQRVVGENFVGVHGDRQGPDRSSRDFRIVQKGFELNSANRDNRYESSYDHEVISRGLPDVMTESVRWVQDRQVLRDAHLRDELIELGNSDIGNRDEPRIFPRKLDYHDSEAERYGDRGSREGSHEFNRTPRKQIQKKSALLRIQMAKPNHRGREDERSHYMSYSSEVKSGAFRGKDQLAHSDHGMEEKEREGSVVELDVSFKSNSLVAKAIVAPSPSSSEAVSDTSLTPRAGKIRKVMASNRDSSSSQLTKVNEGSIEVDDSTRDGNNASSSEDLKQSEAKGASGIVNRKDSFTKLCSSATDVSLRKSKVQKSPKVAVTLDGPSRIASNASTCDKDPKHSAGKVKSSGTGNLRDGGLQSSSGGLNVTPAEKRVDTGGPSQVASNASTREKDPKHSEGKAESSVTGNRRDSGLQSSSSQLNVTLAERKVEASHKSIVPEKDGANVCNTPPVKVLKKKKKVVKKLVVKKVDASAHGPAATRVSDAGVLPLKKKLPPVAAKLEHGIDPQCCPVSDKIVSPLKKEPSVDAELGPSVDPQCCLVSDKGVSPLKEELPTAYSSLVHSVDLQHCPKGANLPPDNERTDGALGTVMEEVFPAVDPHGSSAEKINRKRKSLSPPLSSTGKEEAKIHAISLNAASSSHGLHTVSNIEEDSIESLKTASIAGSVGDFSQQCYENRSNNSSGLVRSEENTVNEDVIDTNSSFNGMARSTDFDGSLICDASTVDACSKHGCADRTSPFVKTGIIEGFPTSNFSTESSEIAILPCSDETGLQIGPVDMDCSNHHRGSISNLDSSYTNSVRSKHDIGDDFGGHLSPQGVTISHEIGVSQGSPNAIPSVGREEDVPDFLKLISHENGGTEGSPTAIPSIGREEDMPDVLNKIKTGIAESVNSSSLCSGIAIASADLVNSANCLETTLSLSNKDPTPSDTADVGCLDIALQCCVNEITVGHESGSRDTFSEAKVSIKNSTDVSPDECSEENKKQNVLSSFSSLTESVIREGVTVAEMARCDVQLPANSDDHLLQSEQELTIPSTDALITAGLPPMSGSPVLLNNSADGSSLTMGLRNVSRNDNLTVDCPRVDSYSAFVESAAASPLFLCPSRPGCDQLSTVTPATAVHGDPMDIDDENDKNAGVGSAGEQTIICYEAAQSGTPPENQSSQFDQRLLSPYAEQYESYPFVKEDLPSVTNSSVVDGVPTTRSDDELMPVSGLLSLVDSPEVCNTLIMSELAGEASERRKSVQKIYGAAESNPDEKTVIEGDSLYPQNSENELNPIDAMEMDHSVAGKSGASPSEDSKNTTQVQNPRRGAHGGKNQPNHAVQRNYLNHSPFFSPKNTVSSARTWHRPGNSTSLPVNYPSLSTVPSKKLIPKKVPKFPAASYIRKGNSLVRNSASSSVYRLNNLDVDEMKKCTGGDSRADVADSLDLLPSGVNAPFERPRAPLLPSLTKVLNHPANSSGDYTSSLLAEPSLSDYCEPRDHTSPLETDDMLNLSEDGMKNFETLNENSSVNNLDSRTEHNGENLVSSNVRSITYVKPKSNQLVATSDQRNGNASIHNAGKNQTFSSLYDGYYKRSKNQLIRTAMESEKKQTVMILDEKSNSGRQATPKVISGRNFSKRHSQKVVAKNYKRSKFSMVWTLRGAQLSNNHSDSLHPKVFPQLFPWKRVTYWRSFINSVSWRNSSLSVISQKLPLSRRRNAVYTRSINGFSLRKSKVLSVGCSSLKWSKSIESRSKKANEEATLAVAAAERKKREQSGVACTSYGTDNKINSSNKSVCGTVLWPGERIFRIGSVRYKMDSSRRTLQRISDDESSCSAGFLSENNTKKSFVPRRLIIGNDEYVRIGNGNQLVRDPKKRARILASEKVRWSLHTARLRLSKKRKYCQFFTRFGKCNKDDGKCPYIHDSSKIAVCTKFLKGLCSNPGCRLTHKVIPERMPDCSYFLQGLCTNEDCPYRHVHVNPNASTCEGFLRGYCADGNECRKKHSYVCPIFEATGSCSQGSKCRLHHPKKWSRGKKSQRSRENKNGHGRYFGSMHVDILEPGRVLAERQPRVDDNLSEGQFSDYISLDVSDEEARESCDAMSEQAIFGNDDPWDSQLDDLDELIKPIGIMNRI